MRRSILPVAVLILAALCLAVAQRVLAQTSAPAGTFESVVGFDVSTEKDGEVFFSVLVRDVMGNMRVQVYDGAGTQRGEIRLKPHMGPEPAIRPD